jgi:hypothetical protein
MGDKTGVNYCQLQQAALRISTLDQVQHTNMFTNLLGGKGIPLSAKADSLLP